MSSQNNMRKYRTKWHEQVFSHALGKKISRHTLKIGPQITPKRPPPKCTGTASRGSSIRAFISNLDFFEKEKLFFCESYYFYLFSIIFTNVLHGIRHHPYLRLSKMPRRGNYYNQHIGQPFLKEDWIVFDCFSFSLFTT